MRSYFSETVKVEYERGEEFPSRLRDWQGDWIMSFKSDLVLPEEIIKKAQCGAVNFHPSLPKYRGIGGYVEAIKNSDKFYGATCHWMDHRIDHGPIIKTAKIPIDNTDDLNSVYHKAGFCCLSLLLVVLECLNKNERFPVSDECWDSRLYLYRDYQNELKDIKDFNGSEAIQLLTSAVNDSSL
jgi:methionyl-tRNA formyltransferase